MLRKKILYFLRIHPYTLASFWKVANSILHLAAFFIPVRNKTMLITSFAGRKFDDSPKALYEEIIKRNEFDDWDIIWAFVEPKNFDIPRGRKVEIDTWAFFKALLYSNVWISNSGMDRNIGINRKKTVKIETWHGTPIKRLGIDQNSGTLGNQKLPVKKDNKTIRCAQSEYDLEIFERVFNATRESFLICDLPRNDALTQWTEDQRNEIRRKLGIKQGKKIILYMPTYREYLINSDGYIFKNPIDIRKWKTEIGNEYVILFRAHYAVAKAFNIETDEFIIDVSSYPTLNDLYVVADVLMSDYSSAFFDYSILDRPMLCFAFDYEEYKSRRGLYIDMEAELPCKVRNNEDEVLKDIAQMDYPQASKATRSFHLKYVPNAGNASKIIVDEIQRQLLFEQQK